MQDAESNQRDGDDRTVVRDDANSDSSGLPQQSDETVILPRDDDATVMQARDSDATVVQPRDDDATVVQGRDNDATMILPKDGDATIVNPVDPNATIVNPANDDATLVTATPSDGGEMPVGHRLKDRFVIDAVLGHGGMGVVYRATDLRKVEANDSEPHVALKALLTDYAGDDRMVIALQREARKAQTLAHPNIATVFDFDRDGDLVYLTMEVLAGLPMDDFLDDNPDGLPPERVRPIIRGMSLGLAYAHNHNIIHSDFKPGNVFIDPETDKTKVLDFGIARAAPVADEAEVEASSKTEFDAGELGALTPSYASVEMFRGADPHPADDVYALALTAYELFTGRHPFDSKPSIQAQAEGLQPKPIPGLKRREWRAIRKGLAFNREDRLPHAADFLRAFEGAGKIRMVAGIAATVGVLFAGYAGYVQMQEVKRASPDVPFEELAPNVQLLVQQNMSDGAQAESFGMLEDALRFYQRAYEAHPRNTEATEKLLTLWPQAVERATTPDSQDAALQGLEHLIEMDDYLRTHPVFKDLVEQLEAAP